MRLYVLLLAILVLFLPVFEGTNTDGGESTKNIHYTLSRSDRRGRGNNQKNGDPIHDNKFHPPTPTTSQGKTSKSKKWKASQKALKIEEQRQVLLTLKQQLKNEGITTEFLDKFLNQGSKTRAKIFERLIKKAKKKIAKSVKKKNKRKRRRRGNKRVKEVKEVNLLSGKSIPSIKSLTGGNRRSQVRGSLNPCPTGQTRTRGRCRCPYLSSWKTEQNKCKCIYGTYRDQNGNCKTHF